ncbi:MAG TPA: NACHT domain-containing protein, partial [Candidatus Obscuribacterales bacterium]
MKIAQQELTQQRYPQLREAKLDQFLTPEEYSLTQDGNLTSQEWQDIFIRLNMAACKGGGFQLPSEVYLQVADLLHTTFPKALRETLKEDFAKDGKAFAGLTLQLLTGMKAELTQLRNTNLAVNTAELTQIIQQFQQLETQLRGTVAQQQAFFRQISQDIDSGFAEVCQQLGVMETNITTLLQNLEKRLDALDEKLTRLEAPRGRSLSKQEYRNRQNVLTQMRTEVESRLTQSIHRAAFVNLGKEQQPHQVQRPWDMSVKVEEQRSVQLPPQTTILDVFDNPTISGKFLILGKPGGGKSTTLLELAEALIARAEGDNDAPIPVILELSTWQEVTKRKFLPFGEREKYDPSIKEWILSQLRGVSQEMGEQWLREKELVLLLDGLDELQPERQGKCVRAINQFLGGEFSPLHLVVCSRKEEYEVYEEMLHLNGAICLEDLTVEQMRHYFASVNLGEFWESIKDSEKIVSFISQPLFLAITSIAYQQIDIEEWRNINTIQKKINYLIDKFCNGQKTSRLMNRSLAWIAKYLGERRQEDFIINSIQPNILGQGKKVYDCLSIFSLVTFSLLGLHIILMPTQINWLSTVSILMSSLSWTDISSIIASIIAILLIIVLYLSTFLVYLIIFTLFYNHKFEQIDINEFNLFSPLHLFHFLTNIIVSSCKIFVFSLYLLLLFSIFPASAILNSGGTLTDVSIHFINFIKFFLVLSIVFAPGRTTDIATRNNLYLSSKSDVKSDFKILIFNVFSVTLILFFYYRFIIFILKLINLLPNTFSSISYIALGISIYIGFFWGGGYDL